MILSDILPFRLYENICFIGSSKVSVHLIETEAGLVLIDTGYPDMYDQILNSMENLGFDPKDICAIFHSHGHVDHFGCTQRLVALSGAKTYISRIDNDIVNGKLDLSWARELNMEPLPFFDCDILVEDRDVFTFGSTTIRCRLTPGHTDGVLSFFVTVPDGKGGTVTAAMHGGIGQNTFKKAWLDQYGFSTKCREVFRRGLHDLAEEKVDFVLGNHPKQSGTEEKLLAVQRGESILDPEEWKRFLIKTEKTLDKTIADEA